MPLYIRKIVRGSIAYRPWRFLFSPFYPFVYPISSVLRRRTFSVVKNILVVNLGAIGDNLLSTPALRALKKEFPQANIDVITGSKISLQAYNNNPRVRKVFRVKQFSAGSIKYKFSKKKNIFTSTLKAFIYYPALVIKILLSNYQLGLNFCAFEGGANFSNILMYLAGIPKRLGNFGTYQELLTNKKDRLKSTHWVDIYLEIVSLAGAETSDQELEFFTSDSDERFSDEFLKENKINSGEIVFSVCPGGSTYINNKKWGIDKFGEVINRLNTKYSFCVLLLGLEEDEPSIYLLQDKLKVKSAVLLGAKLSQVASLLRRSDVLITNDNAILHLADAVKVP